jgi:hypothetical protein
MSDTWRKPDNQKHLVPKHNLIYINAAYTAANKELTANV